ncbi:hypothetical protein [Streptomyces sp. MNP-20]|uniref:hypothetical protein n=1 Tax=Streptomyces sp. MNP-20 TaxID=2721165 RepID=UPI001554E530|nr:hypothetical protein [Streptomyces sp. MNP-20]
MELPGGTIVYHTTDYQSAISILRDGIRQVESGWAGGGLAGIGFYTHREWKASTLYHNPEKGPPVTLAFHTQAAARGRAAPQDVNVGSLPALQYVPGNDFIAREEDQGEIKWHSGALIDQENVEVRTYSGSVNDIDTSDTSKWEVFRNKGDFRSYVEDVLVMDWD